MTGERASNAIRQAEQQIREEIAEAATAGTYQLVERLSSIARRLSDMAEEAAATPATGMPSVPATSKAAGKTPKSKRPTRAGRRTSRREGYPRFERFREALVKIGWSRKGRSEYIHKAPKAGVDAVARRAMDLGKGGQMFTTEDLLPVKLGSGGDDLPGYQAYICLAWLRIIGVVEQHGREGYSVPCDDVVGTVNRSWEALPMSRR